MSKTLWIAGAATAFALGAGSVFAQDIQADKMSFFITSAGPGNGAALGGLAGADASCQSLASAAGAGGKSWHAYLSAQAIDGHPAVNARDRIGSGPWFNAKGVQIAATVAELHGENHLTKETQLTERAGMVNGRSDKPVQHDILTGSQLDGTTFSLGEDHTCKNWTSHSDGSAPKSAITIALAEAQIQPHGTTPTVHAVAVRRISWPLAVTDISIVSPLNKSPIKRLF